MTNCGTTKEGVAIFISNISATMIVLTTIWLKILIHGYWGQGTRLLSQCLRDKGDEDEKNSINERIL